MRKRTGKVTIIVALMVLLHGCTALGLKAPERPVDKWAMAAETYAIAIDTSVELYKADVIDLDDLKSVQQASIAARAALDAWAMALEENRDPDAAKAKFYDAMSNINGVLSEGSPK